MSPASDLWKASVVKHCTMFSQIKIIITCKSLHARCIVRLETPYLGSVYLQVCSIRNKADMIFILFILRSHIDFRNPMEARV
jgi:hypothetical protein